MALTRLEGFQAGLRVGEAWPSLSQLPLNQTSCPRRTTLITYYSNTPDHDSLRNPCHQWPVAATTEDQNRHKMARVPPEIWFGRRSAPTLFNPWETVPICPTGSIQGLQILSTGRSTPFETSTDSTSQTDADHCDQLILLPGRRLHVFTKISKLKT